MIAAKVGIIVNLCVRSEKIMLQTSKIEYVDIITKINTRTYGLHAYYITNECAKILLKNAFPIEQQLDSYISDMLLLSQDINSIIPPLNFYVCRNLCGQYMHTSYLQTKIVG